MEYYKYIGWLVLCVAVLCLHLHAQPAACREDTHCSDGFYCETDANTCRECLSCEDLKREPPLTINTCIKSVAECGSSINVLEVDRHGDVIAESVPPADPQLEPTPSSLWRHLSIGLLFFLPVVVIILRFLLRYFDIFKTADSKQSSTVTACITATAPEAPPPYNPLAVSPHHLPPYSGVEPTAYDEDQPFIVRSPSSRPQDARESAGNQAAVPYNEPSYRRVYPSAEPPVPEYTDSLTLPIHGEDTMPSPWMPGTTSNRDVNVAPDNSANEPEGAGAALSAQLSAARDTTPVEYSAAICAAAKKRCVRQDSQESNSGDSSHSSSPQPGSSSAGGPPQKYIYFTNVVQFNTKN